MNRKNFLKAGALFALAMSLFTAQAKADVVAPGNSGMMLGTTVAARPELAGAVIADEIRPFSYNKGGIKLSGWVQDRVVRTMSNTLDFYYRIHLDRSSTTGIVAVTRGSFAPAKSLTDCDWRWDGLGTVKPDSVTRSMDGWYLYFNYYGAGSAIMPGQDSRFTFIKTRAQYAKIGVMQVGWMDSSGGGVINLPGFQPNY